MCANCRERGAYDPRIKDDLPVVTAHAEHDMFQAYTQAGMNGMYDEGALPASPTVRGLERWSKRIDRYNDLVGSELRWPEDERRLPGVVAVNALTADLSAVYG